jgi:hypothetical protein
MSGAGQGNPGCGLQHLVLRPVVPEVAVFRGDAAVGLHDLRRVQPYVPACLPRRPVVESFGSTEEAFNATQSLLNLRHAFISAAGGFSHIFAEAPQKRRTAVTTERRGL